MPKKITVKPILELRANGISIRNIEAVLHVSRHTISKVYKAADSHSILWKNIKDLDEDKVFDLIFPQNVVSAVFEPVDYEYVHSEQKNRS